MKKKTRKEMNITTEEFEKTLYDELKNYAYKLVEDVKEFKNATCLLAKFDYFDNSYIMENGQPYYRTHTNNIKTFLKRYMKKKGEYKYKDFDDVELYEYVWYKKCSNCGLYYVKPGTHYNVYGYDYKMSYPADMANSKFQIPKKRGIETTYDELPEKLEYGIYRIKISSDNENFKKIFKFNPEHYYTHYSLNFALDCEIDYDIKFELINDGKPNALIYNELISGSDLFGCWYHRLDELKKEMPKNGILKLLASSAWGHIQEFETLFVRENELIRMIEEGKKINTTYDNTNDYIIINMEEIHGTMRYELFDTKKKVYELPLRLLPFITSFSRSKVANMVLKHNLLDDLIRIQTDGLMLSKPFTDYTYVKGLCKDDKITGNFRIKNINSYERIEEDEEESI